MIADSYRAPSPAAHCHTGILREIPSMERVSSAVAVGVAAAAATAEVATAVGIGVEVEIEAASETAVEMAVQMARDAYPKQGWVYPRLGWAYSLLQKNPPTRATRNTEDAIRWADAGLPAEAAVPAAARERREASSDTYRQLAQT